jgi:hypothetical protein
MPPKTSAAVKETPPEKPVVAKKAPKPKTRAAAKKKAPAAQQTSQSIEDQTAAFLKTGGAIDVIQSGISGQVGFAGKKQITISKSGS